MGAKSHTGGGGIALQGQRGLEGPFGPHGTKLVMIIVSITGLPFGPGGSVGGATVIRSEGRGFKSHPGACFSKVPETFRA